MGVDFVNSSEGCGVKGFLKNYASWKEGVRRTPDVVRDTSVNLRAPVSYSNNGACSKCSKCGSYSVCRQNYEDMELPVRICIGVAVVVNLLLLCMTTLSVNALPQYSTTTSIVKDGKTISSRYAKGNETTWTPRSKTKNADVALNELKPSELVSEERVEAKNAKYKDRGRIKFGSSIQSSTSTPAPRRFVRQSTEVPKITIVTPTPEKKNLSQIIDSMREYKKTKVPIVASSSSKPPAVDEDDENEEDDDYDDEDEDKPSSFHQSNNFFTIPGFSDNIDFSHDSQKEDNSPKGYSVSPYDTFSNYFTEDNEYKYPSESYKSGSFFDDFDTQLTTPRNDYFDKKFKEISSSIMKNLETIKAQNPSPNKTNVNKVTKENLGMEKLSNGTPTNKSTVYFKNTKEIRVLDNDKAGSDNKELSDVHGTSIYYEMSVLSTETYAIDNSNEDDCDNETLPYEPTPSTSSEEEIASIKATHERLVSLPTKVTSVSSYINDPPLSISTSAISAIQTFKDIALTTEKSTHKSYSSSYRRNYPKHIANNRDYPNSVSVKTDQVTLNNGYKPVTRKIHYTTPKTKPIWMAPRRNYTNSYYTRTTSPTTIYSEYFNIKNNTKSKLQNKPSMLTTVSSDIDPILQSDVGTPKKVVHTSSISDNSIPQLSKRGSVKFGSSTTSSPNNTEEKDIMEIPPTLTAWALAGLRATPSLSNTVVNNTVSTQKSDDEDELQNVRESSDYKETTSSSTMSPTTSTVNGEFTKKNIFDVVQNKLQWKPNSEPSAESDIKEEQISTDIKSERLPAESNISVQSSAQPTTTDNEVDVTETEEEETTEMSTTQATYNMEGWFPVNSTEVDEQSSIGLLNTNTTKTSFESITKLPSGLTTPQGDVTLPLIPYTTVAKVRKEPVTRFESTTPKSDDFEITTIRFTYIPTILDGITEYSELPTTTEEWHLATVETTKPTTILDTPVTTYRPKYVTTTEFIEETTTNIPDKIIEGDLNVKTESDMETSKTSTEPSTHIQPITSTQIIEPPDIETSTIIVEVVTEINTERETRRPTTESVPTAKYITESTSIKAQESMYSSSEENSGNNEVITHVKETVTTEQANQTEENVPSMTSPDMKEVVEVQPEPTEKIDESYAKSTEENLTESVNNMATVKSTSSIYFTDATEDSRRNDNEPTKEEEIVESSTEEMTTRSVNELEDVSGYGGEMTTEASSRVLDEAGSGAAVAIAVSTIGVIALLLLIGLLLVVRKRGRRGMYAQRCTPVSLDAYSLDSVSVAQRKGNPRVRSSKRSYGNPAYNDEVTSHPMQYAALANFAIDTESIAAEFSEIPIVTVRPDEVPAGCEDKNRYSNVLPLPETRVPLKRISGEPTSEYINANYITGPGNIKNFYIACQAPLPHTVVDFWRMIWEQNSRLIVMLTEYMENGVEKCYEYLPPSEITDNKRIFGDYQVILRKREQRDKYAITSIQLQNISTNSWREVTHLWYFWPAKGVPDDHDSMIDFLSEIRTYMKISQTAKEYDEQGVEVIYGNDTRSSFNKLSKLKSDDSSGNGLHVYSPQKAEELMKKSTPNSGTLSRMKAASEIEGVRPCTVVCASGAGRAAAIIALDICARALAAGMVDVPRVVRELRAQRPHSLINRHHYIFLYKILSEYGNKLMGGGTDGI